MHNIFYAFAILAIIWKLRCAAYPIQVIASLSKIEFEGDASDEYTPHRLLLMMYLSWTIAGLYTSQWPLFLGVLIIGLIPKRSKFAMAALSYLTVLLLILIILNRYHLHIDIISVLGSH